MLPENLKKQLALAVRTIQWSYGIFWSISDTQPGVLKWGDGYYNGDIKTRKTVQSREFNTDQMDFQRSEQLKELYESLSTGEANPQARGPSAALSPEDLTDLEWYYLVCMSFVFNTGQGLPGRTLASSQPIWLRNAHYADRKAFSRSLLAKSVSIKTVVCFPYLGGVIELGITEMVMEDPSLIQLVQKSYLDTPYSMDLAHGGFDRDHSHAQLLTVVGCEEQVSPNTSSSDFASQAQSLQVTEDDFCDCVHNSMNFSDCISQTCTEPNLQEDLHFQSLLSTLFRSSHQLVLGPHFGNSDQESSFVAWKKAGLVSDQKSRQKLLKKVLLEIPRMHDAGLVENGPSDRPETGEIGLNHLISENKRGKLDQRFFILKSLVPCISKVDKVSILDNTIEYLKELEKRVGELEPCIRKRKLQQDTVERTSDNYDHNRPGSSSKRASMNKRKASKVETVEPEIAYDSSTDKLSISVNGEDVLIELRCPWKEGGLLEVMDAVSSLRLDSHSIESSTSNGFLSMTIRSKVKGSTRTSAGMIRQALHRFTAK